MYNSIEQRIKTIIIFALILLGVMGSITMYYSTIINTNIEALLGSDIKKIGHVQKLKDVYNELKALEEIYLFSQTSLSRAEDEIPLAIKIQSKVKLFKEIVINNKKHFDSEVEQTFLSDLEIHIDEYGEVILDFEKKRAANENIKVKPLRIKLNSLREDQDRLVNKLLTLGSQTFISHQKYIDDLTSNANRNLVFVLTLAILAGVIVIILAPQKVTKPIRVYVNAIKELRDLKFETRLPIREKNEMTELGIEINKFVDSFVSFDEMKRKKILFEKRKFQTLAEILCLGVVLITVEGEVLFINTQMSRFLHLSTENFQKKDFHFVRIPDEMKELFEDAIAKKEKFENRMMLLSYEDQDETGQKTQKTIEVLVDAGVIRNYMGDVANIVLTFEDISVSNQAANHSVFNRISYRKTMM